MAVQSEVISAIKQICTDRGIEPESVFISLEKALRQAYNKEYGVDNVEVNINRENGKIELLQKLTIVKKVKDPKTEINKSQAEKKGFKDVKIGDTVSMEVPMSKFGRIAARTAKHVIVQKIREAEQNAILAEAKKHIGEVMSAKIQRMHKRTAIIEIDRAIGILPPEEQIDNEYYEIGKRYRVLLLEIKEIDGRKQIIASRSRPEFLIKLFELEVPEVASGTVQIKGCIREMGSRSKVAVTTDQEGIDPQGACIGQRGIRITSIMNELGDERVDVILWDKRPQRYIANALSPAKVEKVVISKSKKEATVTVADDQLSLAIGRDGQNVRLAAKLTGYKINITSPGLKGKTISGDETQEEIQELTKAVIKDDQDKGPKTKNENKLKKEKEEKNE